MQPAACLHCLWGLARGPQQHQTVPIHCPAPCLSCCCVAGLGRAPATALAYMYWLRGWQLPEALEALTSKRRCSPRVEAIRAATADLLTDSKPCQLTVGIRRRGTAQTFQVRMHTDVTCDCGCRVCTHSISRQGVRN